MLNTPTATGVVVVVLSLFSLTFISWLSSISFHSPPLMWSSQNHAQNIDRWCGKPYRYGSPEIPVGGRFPTRTPNQAPYLDLQCSTALKPYVAGEDITGTIILDIAINKDLALPHETYTEGEILFISLKAEGPNTLVSTQIELVSNANVSMEIGMATLPIPLASVLAPKYEPYQLQCSAFRPRTNQSFFAKSDLWYLPPNPHQNTVKIDRLGGGVHVREKGEMLYKPIFPYGFYTSYGGHIEGNLDRLDVIKSKGYNLVHLVPPFEGVESALDRMEELGLWFIYNMRWSFKNISLVREQVEAFKSRSNLLMWYTADEPDGWMDPLDAPRLAAEEIKRLDPYHPISVALNCQDYYFTEYTEGTDIVLQDAYPIDINATFSIVYNTTCNLEYGDCGCDNCVGGNIGVDIATRVKEYKDRANFLGQKRTMSVWSVPQAFGKETFWPRYPSGEEFTVMTLIAIIHGSLGITPWLYPTTEEIDGAASSLAQILPTITPYLFGPGANHVIQANTNGTLHLATWESPSGTLVVAANAASSHVEHTFNIRIDAGRPIRSIFSNNEANSMTLGKGDMQLFLVAFGALVIVL